MEKRCLLPLGFNFLTLLASDLACMPKVGLTVLEPAEIGLPSDVRTLAVIDRSALKMPASLLGALEGSHR